MPACGCWPNSTSALEGSGQKVFYKIVNVLAGEVAMVGRGGQEEGEWQGGR